MLQKLKNLSPRQIVAILIIVGIGGYFVFIYTPPVDPNNDRLAVIIYSSFPGNTPLSFVWESVNIINADSSGSTNLVRALDVGWALDWSPQGDKIAYYDYGSRSLFMVNSDGSSNQPELIQNEIYVVHMSWSPDGKQIAYADGAGSIYILDLVTRHSSLVSGDITKATNPDWSPDGSKLVFTLNPFSDEQLSSIAIINEDGAGLFQLTPDDGSNSPKWSPDGNRIVFARHRNIYVMNADGTDVKLLIEDGKSYMPSWSPDGKRISYVSNLNQKCSGSFLDAPQFCTNEIRMMDEDGSNIVIIRNERNKRYMFPVWASH